MRSKVRGTRCRCRHLHACAQYRSNRSSNILLSFARFSALQKTMRETGGRIVAAVLHAVRAKRLRQSTYLVAETQERHQRNDNEHSGCHCCVAPAAGAITPLPHAAAAWGRRCAAPATSTGHGFAAAPKQRQTDANKRRLLARSFRLSCTLVYLLPTTAEVK